MWTIILTISPILLPTNSVGDISGTVMKIDNDFSNMRFPINYIYKIGDYICHQHTERTFILNENPMPICARCYGVFLGIALGLLLMIYVKFEPSLRLIFYMCVALIPITVDGIGQMYGNWESINAIRLITGAIAGFASGVAIGVIYYDLTKPKKTKTINTQNTLQDAEAVSSKDGHHEG